MNKYLKMCCDIVRIIVDSILRKKRTGGKNLNYDFDRLKLIDSDTGEILKDYSEYEDPKAEMVKDLTESLKV